MDTYQQQQPRQPPPSTTIQPPTTLHRKMFASMTPWSPDFLKPANGSDFNLYWNPTLGAHGTAAAPVFPGGKNLSEWQGRGAPAPPPVPVCGGQDVTVVVAALTSSPPKWTHNATDMRLYVALSEESYVTYPCLLCNGRPTQVGVGKFNVCFCTSAKL
jgi:hypothetical protein